LYSSNKSLIAYRLDMKGVEVEDRYLLILEDCADLDRDYASYTPITYSSRPLVSVWPSSVLQMEDQWKQRESSTLGITLKILILLTS